MYKLLSLLSFLALALAAPTPEPGAAIIGPGLAYGSPLAYSAQLGYATLPGSQFAYGAPLAAYSAYPAAPIAYSKLY